MFKKFFIAAIVGIIIAPIIFSLYYYYNNRLFLLKAEILWKQEPLNEVSFRNGSPSTKASMAVDIIRSKKYIGEECASIRKNLGDSTGDYYKSDSNLTYKLTELPSTNWILTFVCEQSGYIDHVIIRKSCCSTSQSIIFWGLEKVNTLIK
jgi:hypothetical protein